MNAFMGRFILSVFSLLVWVVWWWPGWDGAPVRVEGEGIWWGSVWITEFSPPRVVRELVGT